LALSTVLYSSMVMVMGPTPPGTGVMALALSFAASNSTSPTSFFSPTRFTDIDHYRPWLYPFPLDHLGAADGGDQHIGPPYLLGKIAGAGMADRHRGMLGQTHQRHRFADDVGAPDYHNLLAGEVDSGLL
jgi:hypothetical protein